jgi:hypothetical protein
MALPFACCFGGAFISNDKGLKEMGKLTSESITAARVQLASAAVDTHGQAPIAPAAKQPLMMDAKHA